MYGALTFDTQTVMTNSFHFDGGLLYQLRSLRHEPVRIIVTEVVRSEILKNLVEKTKSTSDQLLSAIKRGRDFGITTVDKSVVREQAEALQIASNRLRDYLISIDADVIGVHNVQINDLMRLYFAGNPPFSKGSKKDEFPDAVTLLALEAWAEKEKCRILAVSGDSDWQFYASSSANIDVVPNITEALNRLKPQSDIARVLVGDLIERVINEADGTLSNSFREKLYEEISNLELDADAHSFHSFESEYVELTPKDFDIELPLRFSVIDSELDEEDVNDSFYRFVVEVDAQVTADATAYFSISVYDSVDKDHVPLGSTSEKRTLQFDTKLLVYFDKPGENWEVSRVDVTEYPSLLDFGEIEPDFSNEFYDDDQEQNRIVVPTVDDDQIPF